MFSKNKSIEFYLYFFYSCKIHNLSFYFMFPSTKWTDFYTFINILFAICTFVKPFCDFWINSFIFFLIFQFIKDFKPEYIDILGDLIDFWQISKFLRDPSRKYNIQKDKLKQYQTYQYKPTFRLHERVVLLGLD